MQEPWQRQRGRLSHDWLKNQWLPAISKLVRLLRGEVTDEAGHGAVASALVAEFRDGLAQARDLIRRFETEMSPRQLFARAPLLYCDPETRSVLADLSHELWLTRTGVAARARRAMATVDRAEEAAAALSKALARPDGEDTLDFCLTLQEACADLSARLSDFPHRITP